MRTRTLTCRAALLLGAVLCTTAPAATVTLTATIDEIGQNYFGGGVVDLFHAGEAIRFSFAYTPDDSVPAGDDNGMKYVVTEFSIATPAYSAAVFDRGAMHFSDGDGYDYVGMYSGYEDLTDGYGVPLPGVPLLNGYYLSSLGFSLDTTQDALNGDTLNQPLHMEKFDAFNFHFAFREPGTTRAMGTMRSWHLTSLESSIAAIPEPASAALLPFGLALVALRALFRSAAREARQGTRRRGLEVPLRLSSAG